MVITDLCFEQYPNKFNAQEQHIKHNLIYETIVGSRAYGCNRPDSDYDVIGLFLPAIEELLPFNYGYIPGFSRINNLKRKELKGPSGLMINKMKVEIEWINIIEFFYLCGIKASPNLLECLFVRDNFITKPTDISKKLIDNRMLFISHKTLKSFKGYAYSQLLRLQRPKAVSKDRQNLINTYGYDIKMGSHVLRLLDQIEQVFMYGEIDLMANKNEQKAMKAGTWGNLDRLNKYYAMKIDKLEILAAKSSIPYDIQYNALHDLLTEILNESVIKGNN